MNTCTKTQSNMDLCAIKKNTVVEMECAICYKAIQKTFFKCSEPCNKVFHVNCLDRALEQTAEAAWEEDKEAEHKCCYCRREIDIDNYFLQLVARRLITLKASGCYYVEDALRQVKRQMENADSDDEAEELELSIYELRQTYYEKKPKQAKHAAKPFRQQPRMRVKQNIGGRRR